MPAPTAFLVTRPTREPQASPLAQFLCAHGAGAGMETPFLTAMAELLAERGIATHRFEFAYMGARRTSSARRPPPRAERLIHEFLTAVAHMPTGTPLLIGGKSMGGRVASLVAEELYQQGRIGGLVCLGYPFHPPKEPDRLRTRHLLELACPALIVQGERDPFGTRAEVEALSLSDAILVHWAIDGDHDLSPRAASGFTRKDNLTAAADAVASFAASSARARR